MDRVGIVLYGNLTGNMQMVWAGGGYQWQETPYNAVLSRASPRTARRFFCLTAATFARPATRPLFNDAARFIDETLAMLNQHASSSGARGREGPQGTRLASLRRPRPADLLRRPAAGPGLG